MILPDLASVSRLFRRLVITLASLVVLVVLLVVRDRLLFASRSSVEAGYAAAADEVTTQATCFAAGNKECTIAIIITVKVEQEVSFSR